MLMGHPPQIIARGREDAPQGCFEGLTPVQVPMVVEELVACDAKVQEALADKGSGHFRAILYAKA
jgi:hypothetical protein